MLTCYDASFARLLDAAGVDCVLVGDSLGMVIQGLDSTLPVTLAEVAYHTRCVARGLPAAWLIADMPFGSYQGGPSRRSPAPSQLMQAGAKMVKLEGGAWLAPTVAFLVERGIPVCAHLGLTPQSVHALGGYRIQGRSEADAERLLADARALDARRRRDAGAGTDPGGAGGARRRDAVAAWRRSASAPAARCRARCWCCTTCSTSTRAASRASCATSCRASPTSPRPSRPTSSAVKERSFPAPEHGY